MTIADICLPIQQSFGRQLSLEKLRNFLRTEQSTLNERSTKRTTRIKRSTRTGGVSTRFSITCSPVPDSPRIYLETSRNVLSLIGPLNESSFHHRTADKKTLTTSKVLAR